MSAGNEAIANENEAIAALGDGAISPRAAVASLHQAWAEYVAAAVKAQATNEMADGIAAGKAWARWLEMFVTIPTGSP